MDISQLRPPCLHSDGELLITVDTVDAALSRLRTYQLQLIADLDSRGLAKELGARDTVELLSLRHRRNPGDVRRDLKLTKHLPTYAAVTAALPDPSDALPDPSDALPDSSAAVDVTTSAAVLTPELARVIVTTLEKAPPTVPADTLRVAEEQMIEAARYLTPDGLRDFGRKVLDTLDTDGPEPAEDQAYQDENLWIRPVDHGVKFGGFLAGENAEQFKTAIHALAKPHKTIDGEQDPRPRDKRQADALTTILEAAVGNTSAGPGVPHLTVTIDFADLKSATAEAVGELVFGDNLSASAIRRLACDAAVLPIVLGTDSQPLDVGMEFRFVTRPIRRALNRRDKGCVICKAPPSHCHAHHLIHWIDGGPTSITNLVLLCAAHHRAVHAGHWTVTITTGVVAVTRPHWTVPTPGRLTMPPPPGTPRPSNIPASPNTPANSPQSLATLTLDGTAPGWFAPTTAAAAWPVSVDPSDPQPDRLRPTALTPATSPAAGLLSWLTPDAVADLNPWGETGTPSTGP